MAILHHACRQGARPKSSAAAALLHPHLAALGSPLPDPEYEQACSKLQIVLVSDDHLQRTAYNARTLELLPLGHESVMAMLRAAQPDLQEVCSGYEIR